MIVWYNFRIQMFMSKCRKKSKISEAPLKKSTQLLKRVQILENLIGFVRFSNIRVIQEFLIMIGDSDDISYRDK